MNYALTCLFISIWFVVGDSGKYVEFGVREFRYGFGFGYNRWVSYNFLEFRFFYKGDK